MLSKPSDNSIKSDILLEQFNYSRKYSTDLARNLSPEDCQAQSMDDASPAKWHLAHVTWFYEVMVLKSFEHDFHFWNPQFAVLFNSYYNGVGDKHPRHQRGLLTRPSLEEIFQWRKNVESRVTDLIKKNFSPELQWLIQIGINHEQQHQELLLTVITHLFFTNPLLPAYIDQALKVSSPKEFKWIEGISGLVNIGIDDEGFHFDNEGPAHTAFNQTHYIGSQLVTNAQWLLFIEDAGYRQAQWWLDEGWSWAQAENITTPLYWNINEERQYYRYSLCGNAPLDPMAPVSNISYFEADAFARWADHNLKEFSGARLPTEFEWEAIAKAEPTLIEELFGRVWQWTSSNYSPYPRYQPWSGAAGEYNGKFMVNQMVLKGSSAFTTDGHSRATYRNFFPTHTRWQMTGLRLAKDHV